MPVRWSLTVLALCLLGGGTWAEEPAPANEFCPVMPGEKALPEFATDFEGRRVGFCCADCRIKFLADPEAYRQRLITAPPDPRPRFDLLSLLFGFVNFAERHKVVIRYVFGALIALLVALKARALMRRSERPSKLLRSLASLASPLGLVALLLGGACTELGQRLERQRLEEDSRVEKARQTTPQFVSDKLFSWAWPQALNELPSGLKATYYRGNDERSEKLFNGGDYRTATFHLALQTEYGQQIEPGTVVGDKNLKMRLDIVRAPKTALHFFTREAMARVYLVPLGSQAGQKPLALTPLKSEAHWVVEAPLKSVSATGYARHNAAWALLVATSSEPLPNVDNTHYCIACSLHFNDGIVLPQSRLWMLPIFPSPILKGPKTDRQWFSDRPIPEITGENTNDPRLLGVPGAK